MRFWFLVAVAFTILIFSSDIAVFIADIFANKFHYLLALTIGILAFISLSLKSSVREKAFVLKLSSYSFFFV